MLKGVLLKLSFHEWIFFLKRAFKERGFHAQFLFPYIFNYTQIGQREVKKV